jgi:hypothetical protein
MMLRSLIAWFNGLSGTFQFLLVTAAAALSIGLMLFGLTAHLRVSTLVGVFNTGVLVYIAVQHTMNMDKRVYRVMGGVLFLAYAFIALISVIYILV